MGDPNQTMGVGNTSGMPIDDSSLYGNDILSQYLMGPNAQQPQMSADQPPMAQTMVGAPMQPQQQPQAPQTDQESINIEGWRPHKRTTLGTIADIALALLGSPVAPFKQKVQGENIHEAMEGFTKDPLHTIQRMAQIPGMEKQALDLFEHYTDNQRQQASQDRMDRSLDMRNDDYIYQYAAGMMSKATPDNWQQMRKLAIQRATSRGMSEEQINSIIPEDYDADSVDFIRTGSIKPKDQMKMDETHRHNTTREGQMQEGVDERERHNQVSEGTAQGRLSEGQRHNRVTEGQGQTRINNSKNAKPRVVNTPNGPMELSPSGITGKIGDQIWQKTSAGKWKRIK